MNAAQLEPKEPALVDVQQQNGYLGTGIRLEVQSKPLRGLSMIA